MTAFSPRLDVLPEPQRRLWPELRSIPAGFVLYGGTGLALWLGHRSSADFDFFSSDRLDPQALFKLPFLVDSEVLREEGDALTVTVDRGGPSGGEI